MALIDEKKPLLLGESVGDTIQKADDNFTSLFDSLDELDEKIPLNISEIPNDIGYITKDANNLTNYTVKSETGTDIELTVDANYNMTLNLKNEAGTVVSTANVDLPIESMVVGASYENGILTLTLQNNETIEVPINNIISGLVPDTRTVNDKRLNADIVLTQDDIGDGTTYKRIKSGGDITINNGEVTVNSVGGKTADEIGIVKDVKVNGVSVLDANGNAVITFEAGGSSYVNITTTDASWTTRTLNDTTYQAIRLAKTDTAFEVYNASNQKIITQNVIDDNYIYICVGANKIDCTIRKMDSNTVLNSSSGTQLFRHVFNIETDSKHYKVEIISTTGENGFTFVNNSLGHALNTVELHFSATKPILSIQVFDLINSLDPWATAIHFALDSGSQKRLILSNIFYAKKNDENGSIIFSSLGSTEQLLKSITVTVTPL